MGLLERIEAKKTASTPPQAQIAATVSTKAVETVAAVSDWSGEPKKKILRSMLSV